MKILFITCSRIGDAVLTTPILSHILETFPNAQVTIAADPLVAPLFEDYPLATALIPFPKRKHSMHWLHLWKACVGTAWDWVIDLRGSGLSYALHTQKRSIWKQIPNDPRHKVEQLCSCLGIPLYGTKLWFSKEKETLAKQLIQKPTLALAPAANWVGKQWPISNFKAVSEQFLHQFPGANIAVFCAPHERDSLKPLLDAIDTKRLYDFTLGQCGLSQAGALIKACHLFVGNDSGLMHMSAAVGTSTIGLFGPSRENNYGPFEMPSANPKHRVMRIPLSYDELSQQDGFSHKAQTCFMGDLKIEAVGDAIQDKWESANTNQEILP